MKMKLVYGIIGTVSALGATLGYSSLPFKKTNQKPFLRKTLRSKYPNLKVPPQSFATTASDSFWIGKVRKLKDEYFKGNIWQALLVSMKKSDPTLESVVETYFNVADKSKFNLSAIEANTLSKYCNLKLDSEENDIENFPEVLKDLCAQD